MPALSLRSNQPNSPRPRPALLSGSFGRKSPSAHRLKGQSMPSRPHRGLTRLLTLSSAISSALLFPACATAPKPVTINLPLLLREPCERAQIAAGTVGDLGATIVRQEAAVAVCDARRAAVVAIVDAQTRIVTVKPWWRFW